MTAVVLSLFVPKDKTKSPYCQHVPFIVRPEMAVSGWCVQTSLLPMFPAHYSVTAILTVLPHSRADREGSSSPPVFTLSTHELSPNVDQALAALTSDSPHPCLALLDLSSTK